jgi:hypothetical protein
MDGYAEPSRPAVRRGGCHCGDVAFEVDGEPDALVSCNCSICSMRAYLHWVVPRERFRLLTPEDRLTLYRFGTGVAQHLFCRRCGICSFYVPRSDPEKISVNARCVQGLDLRAIAREDFDGRDWERAHAQRRAARGERAR